MRTPAPQPSFAIAAFVTVLLGTSVSLAIAATFDTDFDDDGLATIAFGGYSYGEGVAVQADGKIVVCGWDQVFDTGPRDFVIARLNSDGSLDPSFDGDGRLRLPLTPYGGECRDVLIQPDGKIVVIGGAYLASSAFEGLVARFLSDGTPDSSFAGDGINEDVLGNVAYFSKAALQADGKILITAGEGLVRVKDDGTLDTGFAGDGRAEIEWAQGVAVQADQKIVVAGATQDTQFHFAVTRLLSDGTTDSSFDGDGIATTEILGDSNFGNDLCVRSDGSIVVAGYTSSMGGTSTLALVSFTSTGAINGAFDTDGKVTLETGGFEYWTDIVCQGDDKVVVAGSSYSADNFLRFVTARYAADGSPDGDFDADGVALEVLGYYDFVGGLALQPDGRIVVAGTRMPADGVSEEDPYEVAVVRYLADSACATPAVGCLVDGKSSLSLHRDPEDASKRKFQWKWDKGAEVMTSALGDPLEDAGYQLCVYANGVNVLDAQAPGGDRWKATGTTGYKYKNAKGNGGLSDVGVKSGIATRTKALAKGKGERMTDLPLPLAYPVSVQLRRTGDTHCYENSFSMADESKNDAENFKAAN